jgi:hypothetical protein
MSTSQRVPFFQPMKMAKMGALAKQMSAAIHNLDNFASTEYQLDKWNEYKFEEFTKRMATIKLNFDCWSIASAKAARKLLSSVMTEFRELHSICV